MNTQKQIFLIVVLVFLFGGSCAAYAAIDLPVRFDDQAQYQYEGRVERGALLFANNCRTCHGIKGEGFVGPVLNKPEWQDQSPLVLAQNQALIRRTLECGRANTLMPAWAKENQGSLSRIQIEHLVELLTSPATELDEEGNATSKGWLEALEFAHNLNHEASAVIGGDTLGAVAKSHNIGAPELLAFNKDRAKFQDGEEATVDGALKRGSKVKLLPTKADPNGRDYTIRQDNETLAKIADGQFVGAIIIAELNSLPFTVDYKHGQFQLFKPDDPKIEVPGLLPDSKLKLPSGVSYTLQAGDTLKAIADKHGINVSALVGENRQAFGSLKETDVIDHERRIQLPNAATYIVQTGDSIATIATTHGLVPTELATLNGRQVATALNPGEVLKLPANTRYIVQAGDSPARIARIHNLAVADVVRDSGATSENSHLATTISVRLPQVDAFNVTGQNLTQVAEGYGGVTAGDFAEANSVDVNARLYIGQPLTLPKDTYGTAPPDSKNPGTACVEHAISSSAFLKVLGLDFDPTVPPATVNRTVAIAANSNDWTMTTDGTAQAVNRGVARVARGSAVSFKNIAGLHTITSNGAKLGADFKEGESRDVTFSEAGRFKITCEYHPDMIAFVFVD